MFLINHIILVGLWVLFGFLHSLLAANWWKRLMQQRLGLQYKYYSFFYSVFAAVTLIAILVYQVYLQSLLLYVAPGWVKLLLCLPLGAGLVIMGPDQEIFFLTQWDQCFLFKSRRRWN